MLEFLSNLLGSGGGAIGGNLPFGQSANQGFNISDLFKNKLFLQYLSAAGQDIASGNPISTNTNATTQQQIGSQNMAKLMSNLISNGGKMTIDNENVKMNAPVSAFGGNTGLGSNTMSMDKPVSTQQSSAVKNTGGDMLSMLNPSGGQSLSINPADLAGLSPQDISQALQLKLNFDALQQQKVRDAFNMMMGMSKGEKVPTSIQEFEYAKANGYPGDYASWVKEGPAMYKEWQAAVADGYEGKFQDYLKWRLPLSKPETNINLGDIASKKRTEAQVKEESYTFSHDYVADLDKIKNSAEFESAADAYATTTQTKEIGSKTNFTDEERATNDARYEELRSDWKRDQLIDRVENQLRKVGTIVKAEQIGNEVEWTVKVDGQLRKFRYAVSQ